ncbi:MAG: aldo/keto reductase [Gammaproteobacteria bacterium]|nr:aldo/keto reductase [Gammaproteobacteria bacterium]MBK8308543.1 aldo/keto reductase [Gammaproteobacteria bacterium]
MLTRRIPSSGELLPVIGLGTSDVFDVGADEAARAPLAQVLKILLEAGGSLLDTSPMYGRAEGVSGELVEAAGARARMFLATKVWTTGKAEGLRQIEDSMRLLKTGVLDLVQVHNLVDLATQLANVRALKEAGKLRYTGITHYTVAAHAELERVIGREALDFVQFNYSIVTRDAEQRLLPLAAERKVAVLVNRPYEDGALFARVRGKPLPEWAAEFDCTSWGQFFLKFIVSHPAVSCVIPATSNPRHMLDNAAAGHGRLPEQPMREKMAAYFAAL